MIVCEVKKWSIGVPFHESKGIAAEDFFSLIPCSIFNAVQCAVYNITRFRVNEIYCSVIITKVNFESLFTPEFCVEGQGIAPKVFNV